MSRITPHETVTRADDVDYSPFLTPAPGSPTLPYKVRPETERFKEPSSIESLAYLQLCQARGPCKTGSSSLRQNQRMLASAVYWHKLVRCEWLSNDKFSKAQEFGRHHRDHLL
jgi:hypothetical protein